uniref:(northern house mosquito) hypothetical protein n=1 Tax=Culex pipiens TaxID=7175 RepID=A0A8D8BBG9_CULPI
MGLADAHNAVHLLHAKWPSRSSQLGRMCGRTSLEGSWRMLKLELVVALMLVELLPVMLVEGRGRRSGLGCGTLRQHFRPVWLLVLLLQGMMLLPREKLQMVVVEAGACALAAALLPGWSVTERCRRWLSKSWCCSCRKAHARMEGLKLLQSTELFEQLLAAGLLLFE